jgi:uncharacterized membrane protein YhhN
MNLKRIMIMNIKEKVAKLREKKCDYFSLVLLAMFFCGLFVMCAIVLPQFQDPKTDDGVYFHFSHTQSLWHFVWEQYSSWSGRITANMSIYLSTWTGTWMYRILTPLLILLSGYSISRFFIQKINFRFLLFACLTFGLMSQLVMGGGIFWYTGSYFYILPISLALFGMIPYADSYFRGVDHPKKAVFILFAIAGILGVLGSEQTAVVVVGAALFYHISKLIKKEKISVMFYIYTLLILIAAAAIIMCPGSANRALTDNKYIEGFGTLPFSGHLKLVLYLFFNGMVNVMPLLIVALSCIPLFFSHKFIGKWRIPYLLFVVQFSFAVCAKLFGTVFSSVNKIDSIFDFSFLYNNYNKDFNVLLKGESLHALLIHFQAYIFWAVYLVLLVCLVSRIYEKPFFILLSFLAGFISILLLINSGTMFASGTRVFFVCSIIFMIILCAFAIKSKLIWNNRFILAYAIICLVNFGTLAGYWLPTGYKIVC